MGVLGYGVRLPPRAILTARKIAPIMSRKPRSAAPGGVVGFADVDTAGTKGGAQQDQAEDGENFFHQNVACTQAVKG